MLIDSGTLSDLSCLLHKLATNWRTTGRLGHELANIFGPLFLRPDTRLGFVDVSAAERDTYRKGSVSTASFLNSSCFLICATYLF
jgi:hypothetical protein